MIEVEESYTSKTSFIDNEELRVYQDKRSKDLDNSEERNLTQGNKNQLSKDVSKITIKNNKIIADAGQKGALRRAYRDWENYKKIGRAHV